MTRGHGEKLSRKREQAIAALLIEPTVGDAARKIGIGERTLRRWMAEPVFSESFKEARLQCFAEAVRGLQSAACDAVRTLRLALTDRSGSVRVRAATEILNMSRDLGGVEDILERIERLEANLERESDDDETDPTSDRS